MVTTGDGDYWYYSIGRDMSLRGREPAARPPRHSGGVRLQRPQARRVARLCRKQGRRKRPLNKVKQGRRMEKETCSVALTADAATIET
jgi:hypothetical protein